MSNVVYREKNSRLCVNRNCCNRDRCKSWWHE